MLLSLLRARGTPRRWIVLALVAGCVAWGTEALADGAQDRALARSLFDEARRLASGGSYAEACPKFQESQRLDPGIGTQFNLADCLEHVGRKASAWVMFLEVAAEARQKDQPDRETVARERAAALEPTLARLKVIVPKEAQARDLAIMIDGTKLGRAAWDVPTPVDEGTHEVRASAPGYKPWRSKVTVTGSGTVVSATVPRLEIDTPPAKSAEPPAQPPQVDQSPSWSTRKTAGVVVGGAGVVSLLVSGGFALQTRAKLSDAEAYCSDLDCWDQRGVDLHHDAVTAQTISLVSAGVGVAAVGVGAWLFFGGRGQGKAETAVGLVPSLGGMTLKGWW